ncbi:MAG: sigma-70 family RNA polymerase sigma factor [Woeseiaceae bacterium]|nr:sigma-70 family RNA polymerase sigma factor [Woeseiaceae bacterium]
MTDSFLQRIAGGDRAAVAACIDTYSGLVWSLARRFLRNEADAEEAVQEIFLELWEKSARFDPSVAAEVTFVSMIARRRLIDRRRKLDSEPFAEALDEIEHSLCDDAQGLLEVNAELARVVDVIRTLKPEQQEVINMASWLGMSHGAIAEQTGIPLGTVKSYVSRGLLRIREALGEPELAGKATS